METWYGSPTPSYVPNHKLMATEQEKSLPSGERAWWPGWGAQGGGSGGIPTVAQMGPGPPRGLALGKWGVGLGPWGGWELPPPRLGPGPHQHLCPSFPLTSDPKKEGLEAQVSRLAELIGRLENKVRSLSPCLRPSTPLRPQGGQS